MSQPCDSEAATKGGSVTSKRFARVREIFESALDRPAADRQGYLNGACGEDRELLGEVRAMLLAEEQTEGLLDRSRHAAPSSSSPEEGRFPAGTVLAGRYRILGLLGSGGMGEVYRAYDQILNQTVALKFLAPARISEAAAARFRNEVRIARQVSHPNVCRVYDLGMVEGLHFLSMEYIDGEDLASLLRRIGRLPQDKAIEFTRKICAGLAAAHERGVLHRDLKPANIMIDGRGHVRITDFGLAGLAAEIPLSDLRSGTPAYMSPEQKAGKEVTTRSDLYALGLVLHEMFTGKVPSATQSNPTDLVKDLDPAIERVILRCLEDEPRRRPNSAFSVAMALPGADPVAAALAAGETPSPEMVAASQEKEGFSAPTAMLCFAAVLLCFGLGLWLSERIGLLSHTPLPLAPEALEYKAQEVLREIGYTEEPVDRAYGFYCCNPQVLDAPLMHFWYRQHRKAFNTISGAWMEGVDDPPHLENGMIRMELDTAGKLVMLDVRPSRADVAAAAVDWDPLFKAAGLNRSTLIQADESAITPGMSTDRRFAWTSPPEAKSPIRVEAASWHGRPVYFAVLPPEPAVGGDSPKYNYYVFLPVPLAAAWLAWKNRRLGRGDRHGAMALSTAAMLAVLGMQSLVPLPSLSALAVGTVTWIYYTAVEPFVRRSWPDSLISWARLTTGKFRDPLVASHVLLGLVAAEAWALVLYPLIESITASLPANLWSTRTAALGGGFGSGLAVALLGIWAGILVGLGLLVLAAVLRRIIRRLFVADALAAVLVSLISMSLLSNLPFWLLWADSGWNRAGELAFLTPVSMIWLWMLRRFGFLSMLTLFVVVVPVQLLPLHATGWAAGRTIPLQLIPVALAAWALWVILAVQRKPSTELGESAYS